MLQTLRKSQLGFVAIELAVVFTITGILVLLLASFVMQTIDGARLTGAVSSALDMRVALARYQVDHAGFPPEGATNWSQFAAPVSRYLDQEPDVLAKNFVFLAYTGTTTNKGRVTSYVLTVRTRTSRGEILVITPDNVEVVIPAPERHTITLEPTEMGALAPGQELQRGETLTIRRDSTVVPPEDTLLLLHFNLATVPKDAIITGSRLELIYSDAQPSSVPGVVVYEILSAWTVGSITPTSRPIFGMPISSTVAMTGAADTQLVLDGLEGQVQDWVQGVHPDNGLAVRPISGQGTRHIFSSAAGRGFSPRLVVEYRLP